MGHQKFPSIESFAHVYRGQQRFLSPEYTLEPAQVTYGAKIKLHGTNAGIRIDADGTVTAQGRNRDLFVVEDQHGFAAWVKQTEDHWKAYAADLIMINGGSETPIVVYGEWAGSGIQKRDAVTQLSDKFFFVFNVYLDGHMITDPDFIEEYIPDLCQLMVLPWHIEMQISLDYRDATECGAFADFANEQAEKIGEKDPFISEIFEVDGPGEGLVFTPMDTLDKDMFSALTFKAKTASHNVKAGKSAQRDLVIPEGVAEFVDMFVTPSRLDQALEESCEGIAEPERIGAFLKWFMQDVQKESIAELEDSELEWKHVSKEVQTAARNWFMAESKRVI